MTTLQSSSESAVSRRSLVGHDAIRSTRAVIDLDAIMANVRAVRAAIAPQTALIAVVKANAYGHGATVIARTALDAGASFLAVATVCEGQVLRRNGISADILVLGPVNQSEYADAIEAQLVLTLSDSVSIKAFDRAASAHELVVGVHLKIDTGMNRYGCDPDAAVDLARQIEAATNLRFDGVFTHFAESDAATDDVTRTQADRFDRALANIESAGIQLPMRHAANSGATLRSRDFDYDAVRLGIAMYGLAPSPEVPLWPGMRPAMTLQSRVVRVHELQPGEKVSYGGTYVASRRERVALIPCGYADGFSRAHSNRGWLAAGLEQLPIRGRVCMDQLIVGLSDKSQLKDGDSITLMGDGSDAAPTTDAIALALGTINYEIATSIAARVPRVYVRGGAIVAVEDPSGLYD